MYTLLDFEDEAIGKTVRAIEYSGDVMAILFEDDTALVFRAEAESDACAFIAHINDDEWLDPHTRWQLKLMSDAAYSTSELERLDREIAHKRRELEALEQQKKGAEP